MEDGEKRLAKIALIEICDELAHAVAKNGPMASAHEGYAVILEEMDELKEHVWRKPKLRNVREMRAEARQVAAMAVRFMIDVCAEER